MQIFKVLDREPLESLRKVPAEGGETSPVSPPATGRARVGAAIEEADPEDVKGGAGGGKELFLLPRLLPPTDVSEGGGGACESPVDAHDDRE